MIGSVARSRVLAVVLAAGCADPPASGPDALPPGTVSVTVASPNGGESLYAAEAVTVSWTGADGADSALTYDIALVAASGTTTDVRRGIVVTVGEPGSITWAPVGVPSPTAYRIRVTSTNSRGAVAVDDSDSEFTVSPPAQGVSFAAQLVPIFTQRCTTMFCHGAESQVAVLNLAPGAAYGSLVNVASRETPCTSYMRVLPGEPDRSYLYFKLQGTGPCFYGLRMPKNATPLTAAQISLVREWIVAGAKNN